MATPGSDVPPDQTLVRIRYLILLLTVTGVLIGALSGGVSYACGFLLGALAGEANYWWLKRLVGHLGESGPKPPSTASAVVLGLRYGLLGLGGYAILRYTSWSFPAALLGLFVPVAAVILGILIELIFYGSTS